MHFRRRFAWLTLRLLRLVKIIAFTAVFCPSQSIHAKGVNAYITTEMRSHYFRGAVLVGMDGKVVFEKAYGAADEEWDLRNTPTTKFRIASLTKQFTAACVLLLQERGLLNVQEPISKYLSGLPAAWGAATIHQLLTHTSGVHKKKDSELDRAA